MSPDHRNTLGYGARPLTIINRTALLGAGLGAFCIVLACGLILRAIGGL